MASESKLSLPEKRWSGVVFFPENARLTVPTKWLFIYEDELFCYYPPDVFLPSEVIRAIDSEEKPVKGSWQEILVQVECSSGTFKGCEKKMKAIENRRRVVDTEEGGNNARGAKLSGPKTSEDGMNAKVSKLYGPKTSEDGKNAKVAKLAHRKSPQDGGNARHALQSGAKTPQSDRNARDAGLSGQKALRDGGNASGARLSGSKTSDIGNARRALMYGAKTPDDDENARSPVHGGKARGAGLSKSKPQSFSTGNPLKNHSAEKQAPKHKPAVSGKSPLSVLSPNRKTPNASYKECSLQKNGKRKTSQNTENNAPPSKQLKGTTIQKSLTRFTPRKKKGQGLNESDSDSSWAPIDSMESSEDEDFYEKNKDSNEEDTLENMPESDVETVSSSSEIGEEDDNHQKMRENDNRETEKAKKAKDNKGNKCSCKPCKCQLKRMEVEDRYRKRSIRILSGLEMYMGKRSGTMRKAPRKPKGVDFPMSTVEQLAALQEALGDKKFFDDTVAYFSWYANKDDLGKSINGVIEALMGDQVVVQVNFEGRGIYKKISLCKLFPLVVDLIIHCILDATAFEKNDIYNAAMRYFQRINERLKTKQSAAAALEDEIADCLAI